LKNPATNRAVRGECSRLSKGGFMLRMDRAGWQRRLAGLLVAALLVLGVASAAGASTPHTRAAVGRVRPAVVVQPHRLNAGKPSVVSGQVQFECQRPSAEFKCYGPEQIRHAYGFDQLISRGITGKGRSIVIIDAFQSPTIRQDLALFNRVFGLPSARLNIFAPQGLTPFNPDDPNHVGWSSEISLDVEWAHAIAPKATINLVLAKSNNDPDILAAIAYAVNHNLGDVISMSFGEYEGCVDPAVRRGTSATFQRATAKGISLFASSGDLGSAQPLCTTDGLRFGVSDPASHPLVTGVGGTILNADLRTGAYVSERAWKETLDGQVLGTGGGFSRIYGVPSYQRGRPAVGRADRARRPARRSPARLPQPVHLCHRPQPPLLGDLPRHHQGQQPAARLPRLHRRPRVGSDHRLGHAEGQQPGAGPGRGRRLTPRR
jgi:hypothetical protein